MRLLLRRIDGADYAAVFEAMRQYTDTRDESSADQIWLTEHQPVFTQGQAGKAEHVLQQSDIPIVQIDRGGQVTYHGPGQAVVYVLIDIKRQGIGVREMVTHMENAMIDFLKDYGVDSFARADAPGVYTAKGKIGALGLRVRRGCTYHGLALNIKTDLSPFSMINPCGYAGMAVAKLDDFAAGVGFDVAAPRLVKALVDRLNYPQIDSQLDTLISPMEAIA
ncbi:MAG: lipoyl(octanoyl) transferase LipB [Gammaproteobacteria bacterium]|nr:lipoyl(octanoyl) transferase LipB [Gammaproteobacteria bacterium]